MRIGSPKGFSLIELLIVVALIAILAAIAIPAYNTYKRTANRAEGKAALVEAAQNMETYFTRNNTYTGAAAGVAFDVNTEHNLYGLAFTTQTATTYVIEATGQGFQASDAACLHMSISNTGERLPAACW